MNEIKQLYFKRRRSTETMIHQDRICMRNEHTWVRNKAHYLVLRIIVAAHCEERGHRVFGATKEIIQRTNWWLKMKRNVEEFRKTCIHCITSNNGNTISRMPATALYEESLNEVVQANFLYMAPSNSENFTYVLLIKKYVNYIQGSVHAPVFTRTPQNPDRKLNCMLRKRAIGCSQS